MLSDIILVQLWRPVASTEALDLLHWAMRTVTCGRIATAIKNGHLFRCICWLLFVCLLPWRPLGQYVASSRPMAVSSGFRSSPGQPHWAICLYCAGAPPWPSKRPADKVHSFVIINFVINNNRSQRPCYGSLKLKLRHSNIYYNVISLLLCFGRPPTRMDAVLATIVAGGRANIN